MYFFEYDGKQHCGHFWLGWIFMQKGFDQELADITQTDDLLQNVARRQ
jgi:hypothetical protein